MKTILKRHRYKAKTLFRDKVPGRRQSTSEIWSLLLDTTSTHRTGHTGHLKDARTSRRLAGARPCGTEAQTRAAKSPAAVSGKQDFLRRSVRFRVNEDAPSLCFVFSPFRSREAANVRKKKKERIEPQIRVWPEMKIWDPGGRWGQNGRRCLRRPGRSGGEPVAFGQLLVARWGRQREKTPVCRRAHRGVLGNPCRRRGHMTGEDAKPPGRLSEDDESHGTINKCARYRTGSQTAAAA